MKKHNNLSSSSLQAFSNFSPFSLRQLAPFGHPLGVPRSVTPRGVLEGAPLLYLNSNNTDEIKIADADLLNTNHKKQAFILSLNVKDFIDYFGLDRIGFLTLTFPDNVKDPKEAYRRFNNMNRRFLSVYFPNWILVKERQVRGAWHYHIIVACPDDIRTGINFTEIKAGSYGSASPPLRRLWKLLRDSLPKYGFGRSELLPIRTSSEVISSYVGKYISKQLHFKREEDKGVRLISYSRNWRKKMDPETGKVKIDPKTGKEEKEVLYGKSSTKMSWNSPGAKEWRRKLKKFALIEK